MHSPTYSRFRPSFTSVKSRSRVPVYEARLLIDINTKIAAEDPALRTVCQEAQFSNHAGDALGMRKRLTCGSRRSSRRIIVPRPIDTLDMKAI
jgi:hypothetical protein